MSWVKTDIAKIIGACIAAVCAILIPAFPPPNLIGVVAGVVVAILGGLGLVSGGTAGNQPAAKAAPPVTPVK